MAFLISGVDYMHPDLFDNFVSLIAFSNIRYERILIFWIKNALYARMYGLTVYIVRGMTVHLIRHTT